MEDETKKGEKMKPKVKMGNTAEGVRAKQIQGLSIIEAKSLRDGAEWNGKGT